MLKKAMIMAAGIGSRLEPLSAVVPKPLVPLANVPAMDIIIKHIVSSGIKNIVANTYYKADFIRAHYRKNSLGADIRFIKEIELSGTAGGVKKCQFFFERGEDFIVLSGDGLTDIDIEAAYISHKKSGSIATIVAKDVDFSEVSKYGIIVPDCRGFVSSFQEKPKKEEAKSNLANTGIYIFNYDIFNFIPQNTFYDFAKNVFPALMASDIKINTYTHAGYWSDIGSLDQYKRSNMDIINKRVSSFYPKAIKTDTGSFVCGENSKVNAMSRLEGFNVIGNNCKIGKNSVIKNSVLWDNVEVKDNITVENSIILRDCSVNASVFDNILADVKSKEEAAAY